MKIILDVMSGDNAPQAQIIGGISAAQNHDFTVVLVGDENKIHEIAAQEKLSLEKNIEIVHTTGVITMDDPALSVVRGKTDSSMSVGLRMLADGAGDAFVSAGNTGALHAGSSLIVRRIRGVRRSAIATILPFEKPMLLIDSGANPVVEPAQLHQFAVMGAIYMQQLFELESPTVGLLNNGTEKGKGTKELQEAYELLEADSSLRFLGNIESRALPYGACDVLVTDGFTGNILLKLTEGLGTYLFSKLKTTLSGSVFTKAAALPLKPALRGLRNTFDSSEYGGAPLLGLSKPVFKAHGSSDAKAIEQAVCRAAEAVTSGVVVEIAKALTDRSEET